MLDPLLLLLLSSLFVPFAAAHVRAGITPQIGLTPEAGGFARLDHGLATPWSRKKCAVAGPLLTAQVLVHMRHSTIVQGSFRRSFAEEGGQPLSARTHQSRIAEAIPVGRHCVDPPYKIRGEVSEKKGASHFQARTHRSRSPRQSRWVGMQLDPPYKIRTRRRVPATSAPVEEGASHFQRFQRLHLLLSVISAISVVQ